MIIGLSGYAQTGKDTVAEILVREHGFERRAFADLLRSCLYTLDPIAGPLPGDDVYPVGVRELVDAIGWDRAKQEYGEVRRLLQVLGTEVVREQLGQDTWVNAAMATLEPGKDYVFSDVRFPNECKAIEDREYTRGHIWRVVRPTVAAVNTHTSENALDGWPGMFHLLNCGTIESLADLVKLALYQARKGL